MRIASAIDFRPMAGERFVAVAAFVAAVAAVRGEERLAARQRHVNEHSPPQTST